MVVLGGRRVQSEGRQRFSPLLASADMAELATTGLGGSGGGQGGAGEEHWLGGGQGGGQRAVEGRGVEGEERLARWWHHGLEGEIPWAQEGGEEGSGGALGQVGQHCWVLGGELGLAREGEGRIGLDRKWVGRLRLARDEVRRLRLAREEVRRLRLAREEVGRLRLARENVGMLRLAGECESRLGLASERVGRNSLALVGRLVFLLK